MGYVFNAAYGVGAATDDGEDMAVEPHLATASALAGRGANQFCRGLKNGTVPFGTQRRSPQFGARGGGIRRSQRLDGSRV
jgi:hypothetical protein